MTEEYKAPETLQLEETLKLLEAEEAKIKEEEGEAKPEEKVEEPEKEDKADADDDLEDKEEIPDEPEDEPKPKSKEVNAIVALRKQNQLLAEQVQFLSGQIEAVTKLQQRPTQTVEIPKQKDRLEEIEEQLDAIADKADAGEISLKEQRKLAAKLEEEKLEIKLERRMATLKPQPAEDDAYVEEQTMQLASSDEYREALERAVEEDGDLEVLTLLATKRAAKEGVKIPNTKAGALELRRRVCKLAVERYGKPEQKPDATEAEKSARKAKALAAKLDAQKDYAPDVSKIGGRGTVEGISNLEVEQRVKDPNISSEEALKLARSLSPARRKELGLDGLF